MSVVLDASAMLAFLQDEPGGERVSAALEGALVSAVNWSEVIQKSLQRNTHTAGMRQEFADIGVSIEAFSPHQAEIAAGLWPHTTGYGLSLGDRACLALAMDKKLPVLTADRAWGELGLEVPIEVIR